MIIELIGPPGVGKSYISKREFKGYKKRYEVQSLRSTKKFVSFIIFNLKLLIFIIIITSNSKCYKRIVNIIFEIYLIYIIKISGCKQVVFDQSLIQSIIAFYIESNDLNNTIKILKATKNLYESVFDKTIIVKNDKNVENLFRREVNKCSFDIYNKEKSKDITQKYSQIIKYIIKKNIIMDDRFDIIINEQNE